ncbi:MAG: ATP-binding cassette domain-containing protein [Treponema sp.]|jgi:peptide/nickel transport system ATP-binding protein|nr:ATP-binding cassette domain-containing protein [Treponema sp.]
MRLELKNVGFHYGGEGTGKQRPWLFRGLNLSFESGCRVALLGDSGSGKTTLGKLLAHYEKPKEGEIILPGAVFGKGCYPAQLILQHPETAVNPRFKMRDVLAEGWRPGEALLERLGIERAWLDRYPQELSGGELQRFCIARALAPEVRFIIADEITAMFDLITQAQLWEALLEEIDARGIGLIAITHDRDLGRRVCEEAILMEDLSGSASRPRN